MASVNSMVIWSAVEGTNTDPSTVPNYVNSDHEVTIIAVDTQKGLVYLNDSGPGFQAELNPDGTKKYPNGLPVTIGAFMNAWQSNSYETIIVSKAVQPAAQADLSVA